MNSNQTCVKIAGLHQCVESRFPNGSYDLYADEKGIVTCRGCGATDLLPEAEALLAAGDSVKRLDAFARTFHRQARRGLRSSYVG
jgi:hypothetical protein